MLTNDQFDIVMKLAGSEIYDKIHKGIEHEVDEICMAMGSISEDSLTYEMLSNRHDELKYLQSKMDRIKEKREGVVVDRGDMGIAIKSHRA